MINDESLFIDSVELVPPLKIAVAKQGEYIYASKRGIVRLRNDHEITLEDVLFSEQAAGNLMSVKRLQEAGMSIKFDKNGVTISKNGLTVVKNSAGLKLCGYSQKSTQPSSTSPSSQNHRTPVAGTCSAK
ncbi:hypothetical protein KR084_011569 [Drosophila pseudotakahashii]|nr:hypothetical protein KR084_011569 [Drosophila pseudotakahashii]